jgi:hypothetical protein
VARPKTSGNGRLRKLECPADGMIAYVSRGAVIRHGLPFCGCGQRMFFDDLEDMFAAVPQQAHEHPDFAAFTEREIRSAQRAGANSVLRSRPGAGVTILQIIHSPNAPGPGPAQRPNGQEK